MPLFQNTILKKHLPKLDKEKVKEAYSQFQKFYSNTERLKNIVALKEENYQEGFLREIFVQVLGYTINPDPHYNLTTEYKNQTDTKKADGAILKNGEAVAVIELKSMKIPNLESIKEQAFQYKVNQTNCKYVITSNFQKIRIHVDNAVDYQEFNLFELKEEEFKKFYLIFNAQNLLSDLPTLMKEETLVFKEEITEKLYGDYKRFRDTVFDNLVKGNKKIDKLTLFKKSQKLLDRFLFVFFSEDVGLIPPNTSLKIIEQWQTLQKNDAYFPLYIRYQRLFRYLNEGHTYENWGKIPAYNGGLFAEDPILDNPDLQIFDGVLQNNVEVMTKYNYETEVDINILGHIFEHSLNEIEEIQKDLSDFENKGLKTSKRKKDGVFYTPPYITQYFIENTVGVLCE